VRFSWPDSARNELRAIQRQTAIRILHALTEYGASGVGDVRTLTGEWEGYFRLRLGDYRVIFTIAKDEITVIRVRH
jgi:mRNA-degrading endonuclease RelE of RelBE toxin-antitoxin system